MEDEGFCFGGIKTSNIINKEELQQFFDGLICCVCGKILRDPIECEKCDTVYCKDCYESLKLLNIKEECNVPAKRANKFLRSILSKLIVRCEFCSERVGYDNYNKHLGDCNAKSNFRLVDDYLKKLSRLDQEIVMLEAEVSNIEKNKINEYQFLNSLSDEAIREQLLKNDLTPAEKIELYKACMEETSSKIQNLLENKGFPVTEEISAKGHFWTPLHYAMHFGKWEVIKYILEYCRNKKKLGAIMRLKSDDKRCPVLCLLKSNAIQSTAKKTIITKLVENFSELYYSQSAINECVNKNIDENVVKKIKYLQEKLRRVKGDLDAELKNLSVTEIRDKLIHSTLSGEMKKIIYNAITSGDLKTFKANVTNEELLFEELSSKGYYWTSLHYAMHFGIEDIILYILKLLNDADMLNFAMRLKSSDCRSPLMCLIKSNSIDSGIKTKILNNIIVLYPKILIESDVEKEIKDRGYNIKLATEKKNVGGFLVRMPSLNLEF